MIIGTGVDVVNINRFAEIIERTPGFIDRVFVEHERDKLLRSLAARFAAKEAVMKALGCGWSGGNWRDIEVVRPAEGPPTIVLHGLYLKESEKLGVQKILLSLSHSETMGTAQVILCQN